MNYSNSIKQPTSLGNSTVLHPDSCQQSLAQTRKRLGPRYLNCSNDNTSSQPIRIEKSPNVFKKDNEEANSIVYRIQYDANRSKTSQLPSNRYTEIYDKATPHKEGQNNYPQRSSITTITKLNDQCNYTTPILCSNKSLNNGP